MSGICGIVNLDGETVDPRLLHELTVFMAFRGPDAQNTWAGGAAGLGHTLLRTTFESREERQPLSLDGKVWITADARIDGQLELKRKLVERGATLRATINDAELILHAYQAWGEDCVLHLIGDFAFAIWNASRQELFCARDHFGVRPFFYTAIGRSLVFSNTLNCLRKHPAVTDKLNDLSIADHLLFEFIQDPTATSFADIQRLAPAQCLTWSTEGLRLRSYWKLPSDGRVLYRASGDYLEHFQELLASAISDRLRTDSVAVEMSGGLDSTSVAALALRQLAKQAGPTELHVYSMVFDHLIPDQERRFAHLAAEHMGIPIHYSVADKFRLYEEGEPTEWNRPQPFHCPVTKMETCTTEAMQSRHRVALTGWDGDSLLNESPKPYFRWLLQRGSYLRLLYGLAGYAISQRRMLPFAVLERLRFRPRGIVWADASYPVWLNPELEQRLDLRARWARYNGASRPNHPIRPAAHTALCSVLEMSSFFDFCDAGVNRRPIEFRHPLLDLRLIEYCLSIPPFPWCVKKEILRAAVRGVLPDAVRLRPKTSLRGFPHSELLQRPEAEWIDRFVAAPALNRYVIRAKIPPVCGVRDSSESLQNMRPLSLSNWLQSLHAAPTPKPKGKERDELDQGR